MAPTLPQERRRYLPLIPGFLPPKIMSHGDAGLAFPNPLLGSPRAWTGLDRHSHLGEGVWEPSLPV